MFFWLLLPLFWVLVLWLVPLRVRVEAQVGGSARVEAEVRWLVLRRRWRWRSATGQAVLQPARHPRRWAAGLQVGRTVWQYLGPRIAWQRLRLHLTVGTGDAMATALVCGAAWSLAALASACGQGHRRPRVDVVVVPQFAQPEILGQAEASVRVRPLYLLVAAWRAWRALRRTGRTGPLVPRMGREPEGIPNV